MSYVSEVADFFLARFPEAAVMSAASYTLIAEWEKQEIPQAIVIRSINECYYEIKQHGADFDSINICDKRVKANYEAWLKARSSAN